MPQWQRGDAPPTVTVPENCSVAVATEDALAWNANSTGTSMLAPSVTVMVTGPVTPSAT
jgi:hypothetical protein